MQQRHLLSYILQPQLQPLPSENKKIKKSNICKTTKITIDSNNNLPGVEVHSIPFFTSSKICKSYAQAVHSVETDTWIKCSEAETLSPYLRLHVILSYYISIFSGSLLHVFCFIIIIIKIVSSVLSLGVIKIVQAVAPQD